MFQRLTALLVLATACALAQQPSLVKVSLGQTRSTVHAQLKDQATFDREEEGQEIWKSNSGPIQHVIIGYDAEGEVRYITAVGSDISCDALGTSPQQTGHAPDLTFQRPEKSYLVIAHGPARDHLTSCSLKNPNAQLSDPD
ncbi:hypothetical protein Acid345_0198 [Candidatus Koribacter versatilis Ellin345]|uniref:Uncharacterized protein n=1 Tax=Koribacter versatilis (strain Ellin345) TaxID=204669 RepID=Q1IV97_KORVE|nr:hypothetical protein [Candidatus Koribacter versatilis]ABF39203.1 hypothetical protein Acid345_0198 [Candidatus Koribacter versatilis Ellin345]